MTVVHPIQHSSRVALRLGARGCIIIMMVAFGYGCRHYPTSADAMPIGPEQPTTAPATTTSGPGGTSLPRTTERLEKRLHMMTVQIESRGVKDARVLSAMRNVPRHWFVPTAYQREAYDDGPLPIGEGQTISQPYIVALMTESLRLKPGEKVLEIGTGSGYQAAVLAELTDKVFTIEIVEPLGRRAQRILSDRGYGSVRVRIGDGYMGWPEQAPFDAIIVTCAPEAPPKALVDQLAVGGRMCIPVGSQTWGQDLILLEKGPDGQLRERTIAPVRFVPMTGESEKAEHKDR